MTVHNFYRCGKSRE